MTTTIKPIETQYRGYRFRSRLEARYAVWLDYLGIRWDYEREGFETDAGRYLPDFWLIDFKVWLEIKPTIPTIEEIAKAEALARDQHPVLIACSTFDQDSPKGILHAYDHTDSSAGFMECQAFIRPATSGDCYIVTDYKWECEYMNAEYEAVPAIVSQEGFTQHGGEDWQRSIRAWNAGRSARFEHGEGVNL